MRLKKPIATRRFQGLLPVPCPQVEVALGHSGAVSYRATALVDTGASLTLADASMAESIGIEVEAGDKVAVSGVDGSTQYVFIHRADLRLLHNGNPKLVVPGAYVGFARWPLTQTVVLGQRDFLERVALVHRASPPKPFMILEF